MDSLFGLDRPHSEEGMELLTTAHDDVELSILKAILEDEGIPCLSRDRGSGSSVRIITGYSMYGTDILVPAECLEAAREMLDAYRNAEPVEDFEDDEGDEE
ncbi:MAG: DUF2007 domain-containing protein [Clostridia bacterium]|nr:DUF2007 domain-containing protein [Clostridia bacterium]